MKQVRIASTSAFAHVVGNPGCFLKSSLQVQDRRQRSPLCDRKPVLALRMSEKQPREDALDHYRSGMSKRSPEGNPLLVNSAQLSYLGTGILAAAVGGPGIAVWSAFFLVIGRLAEAPLWLSAGASFFCAALSDLITFNAADFSWDSGVLPFFVFTLGSIATTLLDSELNNAGSVQTNLVTGRMELPDRSSPATSKDISLSGNLHDEETNAARETETRTLKELSDWDDSFRKRH